ncbi:hypothetical protein G7046_g6369 [Stylonectria norvegica]|nr:hypothetical protein G7046_g6369 [Stylonectria norvegica]
MDGRPHARPLSTGRALAQAVASAVKDAMETLPGLWENLGTPAAGCEDTRNTAPIASAPPQPGRPEAQATEQSAGATKRAKSVPQVRTAAAGVSEVWTPWIRGWHATPSRFPNLLLTLTHTFTTHSLTWRLTLLPLLPTTDLRMTPPASSNATLERAQQATLAFEPPVNHQLSDNSLFPFEIYTSYPGLSTSPSSGPPPSFSHAPQTFCCLLLSACPGCGGVRGPNASATLSFEQRRRRCQSPVHQMFPSDAIVVIRSPPLHTVALTWPTTPDSSTLPESRVAPRRGWMPCTYEYTIHPPFKSRTRLAPWWAGQMGTGNVGQELHLDFFHLEALPRCNVLHDTAIPRRQGTVKLEAGAHPHERFPPVPHTSDRIDVSNVHPPRRPCNAGTLTAVLARTWGSRSPTSEPQRREIADPQLVSRCPQPGEPWLGPEIGNSRPESSPGGAWRNPESLQGGPSSNHYGALLVPSRWQPSRSSLKVQSQCTAEISTREMHQVDFAFRIGMGMGAPDHVMKHSPTPQPPPELAALPLRGEIFAQSSALLRCCVSAANWLRFLFRHSGNGCNPPSCAHTKPDIVADCNAHYRPPSAVCRLLCWRAVSPVEISRRVVGMPFV